MSRPRDGEVAVEEFEAPPSLPLPGSGLVRSKLFSGGIFYPTVPPFNDPRFDRRSAWPAMTIGIWGDAGFEHSLVGEVGSGIPGFTAFVFQCHEWFSRCMFLLDVVMLYVSEA